MNFFIALPSALRRTRKGSSTKNPTFSSSEKAAARLAYSVKGFGSLGEVE